MKKAIEDCVTSKVDFKSEKKRIHWYNKTNIYNMYRKYIWKRYIIVNDNNVGLFDDKSPLINYGIHDGSVLHFGYKPIIKKAKDVAVKKYKKKRIFNF